MIRALTSVALPVLLLLAATACGSDGGSNGASDDDSTDGVSPVASAVLSPYDADNLAILNELPSPPGAELLRTESRRAPYPDGRLSASIFETSADPGEVLAFYDEALAAEGWEAEEVSASTRRYTRGAATITIAADSLESNGQFIIAVDSQAGAAATATP